MPIFSTFTGSFNEGQRPQYINPLNATADLVSLGAIAWFNADLGTQVNFNQNLTSGSKISQWTDASGFNHNANSTGNASRRPAWFANVLNGLGVVRYDGVQQQSNINPIAWLDNLTGFTVYVVAKMSTTTGIRPLVTSNLNDGAIVSNGSFWQVRFAGGTGTSTVAPTTTGFHIFTLIFDGTAIGDANRLRFRYDKVDRALTFAGTVGTQFTPATDYYFAQDGTNFWGGDIAEVAIWGGALTANQISVMDQYFSTHWGL